LRVIWNISFTRGVGGFWAARATKKRFTSEKPDERGDEKRWYAEKREKGGKVGKEGIV